jgi:hypothetical protein
VTIAKEIELPEQYPKFIGNAIGATLGLPSRGGCRQAAAAGYGPDKRQVVEHLGVGSAFLGSS